MKIAIKQEDLMGKTFGKLFVIGLSQNKTKNGRTQWLCMCECGNTREVVGAKLKSGAAKTCGCSRKRKINYIDYIGEKINKWTILSYEYTKNNHFFMKCKCECGSVRILDLHNVIGNKSKDCGCGRNLYLSNKKNNLIGKKFGKLKVLKEIGKNKNSRYIYECSCDCGNITTVLGNSLVNSHTLSCGCLISKYNYIMKKIVNELGYECETEYQIDLSRVDCGFNYMRFDIYIKELNLAIEYDGEQHFKPIDFSGNKDIETTMEELKGIQYRDFIKNKYCYDHNIYIMRIPYTKQNEIYEIIKDTINIITCND